MSARDSWGHEMESVFLYRVVAESETSDERRALFNKLAGEAEAQAAIWTEEIRKTDGQAPAPYVPDARARFVAALVRRFGPRRMKGVLAAMKVRGMSVYSASPAQAGGHPMPHSVEEIGRELKVSRAMAKKYLAQALAHCRKRIPTPGISVAIRTADGRVWIGTSGARQLSPRKPVTMNPVAAVAPSPSRASARRRLACSRCRDRRARPAAYR